MSDYTVTIKTIPQIGRGYWWTVSEVKPDDWSSPFTERYGLAWMGRYETGYAFTRRGAKRAANRCVSRFGRAGRAPAPEVWTVTVSADE